jgi:NADH:ubiquinone oxidoreductase subunit 6 (subunit J)
MLLFAAMVMTVFCASFYLNQAANKSIRATLLSFKGLALNLGYGAIGILYAFLVVRLRKDSTIAADSGLLFQAAADWFPPWFLITFIAVLLCNWKLRPKTPA